MIFVVILNGTNCYIFSVHMYNSSISSSYMSVYLLTSFGEQESYKNFTAKIFGQNETAMLHFYIHMHLVDAFNCSSF